MKAIKRQGELEWRFLSDLVRDPDTEAPGLLDPGTDRLLRAIVLTERDEARRGAPAPEVQARIWQRALATVPAQSATGQRQRRPWSALPLRLAAAACLLFLGFAYLLSAGVQAEVRHLACWIPGLGIQSGCTTTDLVAPNAVSATRGATTVIVASLYSSNGSTTVRLLFSGPRGSPNGLALHDSAGKQYRLQGFSGSSSGSGGSFTLYASFAGLDDSVRTAILSFEVAGAVWHVRVPVVPVPRADLPAAHAGSRPITRHGVTIRVAYVAADRRRTAVQIMTRVPPGASIEALGAPPPAGTGSLLMHDQWGHRYLQHSSSDEISPQGPLQIAMTDNGQIAAFDALFPPLPAVARLATIDLPMVTMTEDTGEVSFLVPVAEPRGGHRIPLRMPLQLGPYRFHVLDARIQWEGGFPELVMRLDLGGWQQGRKLIRPLEVQINGDGSSVFGHIKRAVPGQWDEIGVPLPAGSGPAVTITFHGAEVAVEGPWRLAVPLPGH